MPDEFYERYRQKTHEELAAMLAAGQPNQVQQLVTVWKSIEITIGGLGASLRGDLDRLLRGWESASGREFDSRVGLIATYAQQLAEELTSIHTGLSSMGGALAEAKAKAELPDAKPKPAGNSAATTGALAGALLGPAGMLVGGVIGGALGHEADATEQRKAHERMVVLVSELAAQYRVIDYTTWPNSVPPPPRGMPGVVDTNQATVETTSTATFVPDSSPAPTHTGHHGPRHDNSANLPAPTTTVTESHTPDHDHPHEASWMGTAPAVAGAVGVGLVGVGGVIGGTSIGGTTQAGATGLDDGHDGHGGHGHGQGMRPNGPGDGVVRNVSMSSETITGVGQGPGQGPSHGIGANLGTGVGPEHVTPGGTPGTTSTTSTTSTSTTATTTGGSPTDTHADHSGHSTGVPGGTGTTTPNPAVINTAPVTPAQVNPAAVGPTGPTPLGAAGPTGLALNPTGAGGALSIDPTTGLPRSSDERGWMSEGTLSWRDDASQSAPPVLGNEPE
jgi:uncharacterized protein YukE